MSRVTLIFSVVLNLGLGFWLVISHPPTHSTPLTQQSRRPTQKSDSVSIPEAAQEPTVFQTNRFRWALLESTNYAQYVANLRAVACPEATIRDIVLADLARHFAERRAHPPAHIGFWTSGIARQAALRARERFEADLKEEQRSFTAALLNVELPLEPHDSPDDLIEQAILRFMMGPLPEPVAQKVITLLLEAGAREEQIQNDTSGILLKADKDHLAAMRQESIDALRRLLSPNQYEEFIARQAAFMLMDKGFSDFSVMPDELRKIALIHNDVFGPLGEKPFEIFGQHNDEEHEQQFQARLKDFLGDDRYAQYEREKDPAYKSLRGLLEEKGVAPNTVIQVYEIKNLVEQESQRVRTQNEMPASDRVAQLKQIQETAGNHIQQLLGDQAFLAYLAHGGGWMTNSVER